MLLALEKSYNESPALQGKEGKKVRDLMGGQPFALHGGCAYGTVHVVHLTSVMDDNNSFRTMDHLMEASPRAQSNQSSSYHSISCLSATSSTDT